MCDHSHPVRGVLAFAGTDLLLMPGPAGGWIPWLPESLVPESPEPESPEPQSQAGGHGAHRMVRFVHSGEHFGVLDADEGLVASAAASGARRTLVREAISLLREDHAKLALRAMALKNWELHSNFCMSCGAALARGSGESAGGKVCGACGRPHFPKISPAAIVLVHKGDRVLVAHNARSPAGRFGLIAGFVELGETVEDTVHREIREEAGVEVHNLRYVRSQPWPFPDSLMLAYEAEYLSGEPTPDGGEITELRWIGPDDRLNLPPSGSVAHSLIAGFFSARAGAAAPRHPGYR